jgi:GNAT superfamily N-acetyltransferase
VLELLRVLGVEHPRDRPLDRLAPDDARLDDRAARPVAVVEPAHRGRGHATAIVLRALEEARNGGHELTFLIADENDWPKELYARLGFGPIGRKFAFVKPPRD